MDVERAGCVHRRLQPFDCILRFFQAHPKYLAVKFDRFDFLALLQKIADHLELCRAIHISRGKILRAELHGVIGDFEHLPGFQLFDGVFGLL